MLAQLALSVLANAVGLIIAAAVIDGFSIDGVSFVIAVAIFSGVTALLGPFITSLALKNASFLMGGIALVTTLVGLIITNLLSDGISVDGVSTWIAATVIVWLFSVIASVVLPLFLFKKTLENRKEEKNG